MKKLSLTLLLTAFLASAALANPFITWFPQEFTCPIDSEKNTFMVIGSYGSYIYADRSKYQWLFFPRTSQQTFYMCKKCHLATYMWDFDKLPKEKLEAIKNALKSVTVSKDFKDYAEISVIERIEAMEKVYAVLDKDEEWWENFYRVKGFHYAKAGMTDKASASRKKSLEIVEKFVNGSKTEIPKKLLFYISASMKHFTGNDEGALADLQKALETQYDEKGAKPEDIKSAETGLNGRINDYIAQIKSDKKPRLLDDKGNSHDHDH